MWLKMSKWQKHYLIIEIDLNGVNPEPELN